MNRRTFLIATPTAAVTLASLKAPLFVPVDWLKDSDGIGSPENIRLCDMCLESGVHDIFASYQAPIRAFYLTTDQHSLCVCEHCIGDYLSEEVQQ